jgi:hypothetical protein
MFSIRAGPAGGWREKYSTLVAERFEIFLVHSPLLWTFDTGAAAKFRKLAPPLRGFQTGCRGKGPRFISLSFVSRLGSQFSLMLKRGK